MLNWQGWAANFLGWVTGGTPDPEGCAFQADAFANSAFSVCPDATGVGGWLPQKRGRKRATVVYKDKAYLVPDGAEQAFVQALLDAEPVPKKIRPLAKPAPVIPQIEQEPLPEWVETVWPEYPHLLAEFQRQAADQMLLHLDAIVRERIRALEEDDDDVVLLLT